MEFGEKTLNSEQIYDGKVVKVFRDDVEICDGHKSFREVVKHSGGVVIFALKGTKVLFVRQFRYPMKEILLELPAGKLEYGENPFVAAKESWKKKPAIVQTNGVN